MTKKNIFKTIIASVIAALCLCSQAFAADATVISNRGSFVNEGGYVGTYVDMSSSENIVTSTGRGDHTTVIDNEDIFANIGGHIGTAVKGGQVINVVTSKGGNSATAIDNIKETYNIGGVIETYADVSSVYNDVLNKSRK